MKKNTDILARYLPGHNFEIQSNVILVNVLATEIARIVRTLMRVPLPVIMMFATDERESNRKAFCIQYVFGLRAQSGVPGDAGEPAYIVLTTTLPSTNFMSLAAEFPSLALYEREMMTMFGLEASGHPDPRSLILHEENWPIDLYPLRKDFKWNTKVPETHQGDYRFHKVDGPGIYEIPVGPVHAGIIEPGNFRFSVAGEEIVSLEARLGWVHKGVEKLFENLPLEKKVKLSERISGDSAFSHSLAYCQALESLTGTELQERAKFLRLIFAELERLTMHIFDIGNIAGNGTGFAFMASQGFRLTEELRRKSEEITGSRFLRNINTPGGVLRDISPQHKDSLRAFLSYLKQDFKKIIRIADESASLANRLKDTGVIPPQVVLDYGGVGVAARSNGIPKDARIEYPYAAYRTLVPKMALTEGGDVDARFRLRVKEVFESIALIERALDMLPDGAIHKKLNSLPEDGMAISTVEGWRGEIAYAIVVREGAIFRVKVRDPSFIHWQLFSHISSQDMVPDFPLINKSLNLSYTGNDL
jgi:Ni,Fe-hydrogenase III large subunit/Ni,Fe-hydrogenase III component G